MQRVAAAMEGTKDYGYFTDPKMANALRRAAAGNGGFATAASIPEHEEPSIIDRGPHDAAAAAKVVWERGQTNLQRASALPTLNEYGQRVVHYNEKPKEYFKARTNLPTIRTIDKIEVVRQEDEVLIWFVGKSFLRQQIRNMVSVLRATGHGLWDDFDLQCAFTTGFETSRKKFKRERLPPAPVHGLTLWDIEYPREYREDFMPFVDSGPYEEVNTSLIN
ncbi:unnamed protein product [Phytomonas sp. Hart1]|nr:unnamed protein product [Phytomonas sp. Hart1]|eukprot:CCW71899.1 unnamed protein product [Phytomonas sp. isolate Hart1]